MNAIIALPRRQKTAIMMGYSFFTLCAWLGYGYLLFPMVVLIIEWLELHGWHSSSAFRVPLQGGGSLSILLPMAGSALVAFVCWAECRRLLLRCRKRMYQGEPLSRELLAKAMKASPELAMAMMRTKRGILHMDQHGMPLRLAQTVYQREATPDDPSEVLVS
ncbi:poly-beta-1,6-N-acetyl-D-glucosamine biosynthesis protein PgaD [Halomonas sp. I1]|uniref:poly-beta-1,6-N-acetyl-D-glucosamine biosynthesis protein PgaD n=1 Tax=Halomonas sp. I1 TaxID=393536 RepID=UPI0028E09C04|nr:poly-beta-1,6-N-acetyl-D-glucosamine biosynthesis protein PgaD [Halomonas sp. I1]MDT8894749.1 poly-beta-1,6-N-acetyl-D-glucosamine biosynthesis protein PgaD [Halomonas sp. I1]